MHQSSFSPRAFNASQTLTVPSTAGPSSSLVKSKAILKAGSDWAAKNSSIETTMAAREVFISLLPRPNNLPSRCVGVKGSLRHWAIGPVGTTSVWPANTNVFALACVLRLMAHKLLTRNDSGPLSMRSHAKPRGTKCETINSKHPASSGVAEGRAISCSASERVRDMGTEEN